MNIQDNIQQLRAIIAEEEHKAHREAGQVKLLAVSKGHPTALISEAQKAGINDFGENYLQEALVKIKELEFLPLSWHFIGAVQKNKIKDIARFFSWVHSVSSSSTAILLNKARPIDLPPLNICIQVNLDKEEKKSGILPENACQLAFDIKQLSHLKLCGLMAIPKPEEDPQLQYLSFLRLKNLLLAINKELGLEMTTLSMGMSQDYKAAIKAGSTMIRIGTAIFGNRSSGG